MSSSDTGVVAVVAVAAAVVARFCKSRNHGNNMLISTYEQIMTI